MIFIRNIQIVSTLILFFAIICDQRYLLGNEQQVVIHWTTETDLNSSILLKDRDGNHIDSGTSSNGDGCLATLGYFSLGTSSNPFDGDWIPLTFGTRVGDSSSGYGFANGTFGFTTVFTKNSNAVSVYPNEPASYSVNSQVIIVDNTPPLNHPMCIRFYDRTITGPSARHNTVHGPDWKWPGFQPGVPVNLYFKISNASPPSGSTWKYGSIFEDGSNPFRCSLQIPAILNVTSSYGGTVDGNLSGPYPYDSEVNISAQPLTQHWEFVHWTGGGISDPSSINTKVLMSQDRNITAHFQVRNYNITLSKLGKGTVSMTGNGVAPYNSDVNITAIADYGYSFSHWLNYDSNNNPTSGLDNNLSSNATLTVQGGHSLYAVFDPLPFNIALNSNNGGNATLVEGAGPYYYDSNYTLFATPQYGYNFNSWTSSSGSLSLLSSTNSSPSIFTLNGDVSYTANFSENQYTLTVDFDSGGASVTPSSPSVHNHSSQVPISATPLDGYEFDKWEDENGSLLNFTESNTTVIMSRNAANVYVKALFKPKQYNVTINSGNGGQASIDPTLGPWEHFQVYPVTATPNLGYHFTNWTGDANSINTLTSPISDANNSIAIVNDVNLTANFSLSNYNISVSVATGDGNVTGGGTFTINDSPQLNAIASTGWHFSHWSGDVFALNSNSSLSTSVNLSYYPQNISVQAHFARNSYSINVVTDGNGSVNGLNNLTLNPVFEDVIELNATASSGWEFNQWYGYPLNNPQSESISFSASSNLDLNASFQRKNYSLIIANSLFGESNGSGLYPYESNITITTVPNTGYNFSGWSGDTQYLADPNSSTTTALIPDQNISISPVFTPKTYFVSLSSDANGTVSGGGSYSYGTTVTLSASGAGPDPILAPAGYTLSNWDISDPNGQQSQSSSNPLTFTIDGNYSVFGNFEPIEVQLHDLNITMSENLGGQIFNDTSLREWNSSSAILKSVISVTPNPGYSFIGWENLDNKIISPHFKSRTISFTTDSNASLNAKFVKNIPEIASRVTGNGSVVADSNESGISIQAVPDSFNNFSTWSLDHNFSYNVTVQNSSVDPTKPVYFINGKESPSLTLVKGYTYHFNCNTGSDPFYFSSDANSTNFDQEYTHSNLIGSRSTNGTLIFTVPNDFDSSNELFYCSGSNSYLGNSIQVIEAIPDSQVLPFPEQVSIYPTSVHDLAVHAAFALNQYNVSISAGSGGNITSGNSGIFSHGTVLNLSATPSTHFVFSHWEGSNFSSLNSLSTSATITTNSQIIANFSPILYDLNISKNIDTAGSAFTTNNIYQFTNGTLVTLQATPNPGYLFTSWSNGDTNQTTSVTINTDTIITANFSRKPASLTNPIITLDIYGNSMTNDTGGYLTKTKDSGLEVGDIITITANDKPGFQFEKWIDQNGILSSSRSKTITLVESQNISATFKQLSYEINLYSAPLVGGKISANSGVNSEVQKLTVAHGSLISLSATSNVNYQFEQWSGTGLTGLNTSSENLNITALGNYDISAKFIPLQALQLNIIVEPEDSGYAIGSGTFIFDRNHPIYATPSTGYLFEKWEGVGIDNVSLPNSTIVLNESKTIKAIFKIDPDYVGTGNPTLPGLHSLTLVAVPSEFGSVIGAGVYGTGWVDIEALSATGYKFSYWDAVGVENNQSNKTKFFLSSNKTISAVFEPLRGFDLVQNANSIGNSWWYSDWFGPFWHRDADLWIYHAPLGWMYIHPETQNGGLWFWVEYLAGWQWTEKSIFPFHRAHSDAKWYWFNQEKSTQEQRIFFEYTTSSGDGYWNQY
ncbi:MAG: hypothetical protein CMI23_02205 [Opitutae bacterium]|nr:hypothetical protein [Opitutae bacterium]